MADQELKNLFISLEVPTKLRDDLLHAQSLLPEGKFNLQPAEQIHLTMGYFRGVDPEKESQLREMISSICAKFDNMSLKLNGQLAHNSWVRMREDPNYKFNEAQLQKQEQVRLGLELNEGLVDLYRQIAQQAKETGLLPQNAPETFSPHITIAEAKEDMSMNDIPKPDISGEYTAELITLQREIDSLHFEILESYQLISKENQEGHLSAAQKY